MNTETTTKKDKTTCLNKQEVLYYGQTTKEHPTFSVGDRIEVNMIIQEKNKERIQKFEGDVIGMRGQGACQTFRVRKIGEASIGIELTFPLSSPAIDSIKLLRKGFVRRAKLNYLRDKTSKKDIKIKSKEYFA